MTNIFLLNLVVSDFIFMLSLPFWGIYHQLSTWVFGASMCKVVGSAYYLGYYSSILFLTLLTFDQHLTIAYPLVAPRLRRQSYAFACCTAVWLLSCLACVKPILLYNVFNYMDEKLFCEEYATNALADTINVSVLNTCWMHLQLFFFLPLPPGGDCLLLHQGHYGYHGNENHHQVQDHQDNFCHRAALLCVLDPI